jgi:hypothetical protein
LPPADVNRQQYLPTPLNKFSEIKYPVRPYGIPQRFTGYITEAQLISPYTRAKS